LAAMSEAASAEMRATWLERLRKSVWLEPALRLLGVSLLLGVLAGIGVVATTYAKPGLELPGGSRALTDALGTSWLKPTPAVSTTAAAASAPSGAAPAPSGAVPAPGALADSAA